LRVAIPVLGSNFLGPSLYFTGLNLSGGPTVTANQVVVVSRRARSIQVLTLQAQCIGASFFRKGIQGPIDSRQTNGGSPIAKFLVQLLCADELWCSLEGLPDFFSLLGVSLHCGLSRS
jgi:hypothetical protein